MVPEFIRRMPRVRAFLRRAHVSGRETVLRWRHRSAGERMLPGFLLVGAQKAGTSSLFEYITRHPQVLAPYRKEVHFFDNTWERGEGWYRAFFPPAADAGRITGAVTGEASPYYLFDPRVPERAHAMLPEARIIALLRNPVDRAYSQYEHSRRKGLETRSFDAAVEEELRDLPAEVERMRRDPHYRSGLHQHRAYLARGCYAEQLEGWARWYLRDRILVLRSEDLFSDPIAVYTRVLEFLGLVPFELPRYDVYNSHGYRSRMSPRMRDFLEAYYAPHNERLREWTGGEVTW